MDRLKLENQILKRIRQGVDVSPNDNDFNKLALEIFKFQYDRNTPYRSFCDFRRQTPASVRHWKEIPAVPVEGFKEWNLCTFEIKKALRVFQTSGTTKEKKGKHFLDSLALYRASFLPNFKAHLLPDRAKITFFSLIPNSIESSHSSLSYMIDGVTDTFGTKRSTTFFKKGTLSFDLLSEALKKAERSSEAVCLLGTSFSFVHLSDYLKSRSMTFRLPGGSRLMDTGGFKGRSREISKRVLYRNLERALGIESSFFVNEYGMTEMGSQFYDTVLRDHVLKIKRKPFKAIVPWVRTLVLDPDSMREVTRPYQKGLLKHIDLSNLSSAIALQTEDIGYRVGEGFEMVARASTADCRGCSLTFEGVLA